MPVLFYVGLTQLSLKPTRFRCLSLPHLRGDTRGLLRILRKSYIIYHLRVKFIRPVSPVSSSPFFVSYPTYRPSVLFSP